MRVEIRGLPLMTGKLFGREARGSHPLALALSKRHEVLAMASVPGDGFVLGAFERGELVGRVACSSAGAVVSRRGSILRRLCRGSPLL